MYAITSQGLGRRYGDHWAVKDLDLNIEQGEVFGLLGPNGAGKTTTMRMLACLVAPTAGGATVCGFDVVRNPEEIRGRLGILTEAPGLYENLTAWRNLEFYAKLYEMEPSFARKQIERYLKLLGLWDRRGDLAGTLSKGMKQKLSMARGLLHEPEVVILDEPTSALDPESAKLVRDYIESLRDEGRTVILCTHNLYEAQSLCHRVAIIRRTLLRVGTPRQLQSSLYGRQMEICIANAVAAHEGDLSEESDGTMNSLAVRVSAQPGVGDVVVAGNRLLVSMLDPDEITPRLVSFLVHHGAEILRVAEVEHTLESAYLDLVARQDLVEAQQPLGVAV